MIPLQSCEAQIIKGPVQVLSPVYDHKCVDYVLAKVIVIFIEIW